MSLGSTLEHILEELLRFDELWFLPVLRPPRTDLVLLFLILFRVSEKCEKRLILLLRSPYF